MPAHAQHYLTCSVCGALAVYADGKTMYGETEDCVKAEAADEGWFIDDQGEATNENSLDYCPKCIPAEHKE